MTTSPVRITDHTDLFGAIPYLVGFHPSESLVALVVRGGHLQVTARSWLTDLPSRAHAESLVGRLLERFDGAELFLVAYSLDPRRGWQVLDWCGDAAGAIVAVSACVGPDGWQEYPQGPTHSHRPTTSRLAAQATWLGLPARASREELTRSIAAPSGAEATRLRASAVELADRLADLPIPGWPGLMEELHVELEQVGRLLTDTECLKLALLSACPNARDVLTTSLTRANADVRRELWAQVVRRCPEELSLHPLGLLGMACWVSGEGALVVDCLSRAEVLDPEDGLVRVLRGVVENVVPPWEWDAVQGQLSGGGLADMPADECPDEVGEAHRQRTDDYVAQHRCHR